MVGRIDAHNHAKFSQNWSIQIRHIVIFQIFRMSAAAAILNFWNCKILLAIWLEKVRRLIETHQHAKFRQNWSFSCGDKEFLHFQNGRRCHLEFLKLRNFIGRLGKEGRSTEWSFTKNWAFYELFCGLQICQKCFGGRGFHPGPHWGS